jgi:hypothetical protein
MPGPIGIVAPLPIPPLPAPPIPLTIPPLAGMPPLTVVPPCICPLRVVFTSLTFFFGTQNEPESSNAFLTAAAEALLNVFIP